MKALSDLFNTPSGQMTMVGLGFMLGMGVWFLWYFLHKIKEDAKAAGQ